MRSAIGDSDGETATPIKPEQRLVPRRAAGRSDDLWTVWNRLQENGGAKALIINRPGINDRSDDRSCLLS
nr:hypothetical protein [Ochrobactrum sp. LM19]